MAKLNGAFNPESFLSTSGPGRRMMFLGSGQTVFAEGDKADAIFVILKGRVRLSARSHEKKDAVLDILSDKDFVGEDCIAGERLHTVSASAMTDCTLLRIGRKTLKQALTREVRLANIMCAYVLGRNMRYQRDLVDQRCNPAEKRLARILLSLASFDEKATDDAVIPGLSHETIAGMVGTTRSRVCFFMKRFKESGFIDYKYPNDPIRICRSLIAFESQ
ncbi:MAG: Crp/Fnr family transcriptional regulator [Candidatus Korobacteraceae bacterium]